MARGVAMCLQKLPPVWEPGGCSQSRTETFLLEHSLSVLGFTLECLNEQNLGSFGGKIYLLPGLILT